MQILINFLLFLLSKNLYIKENRHFFVQKEVLMKKLLLLSFMSLSLIIEDKAALADADFNQEEIDQFIKEYPDIAASITKDKIVTAIKEWLPRPDLGAARREILTFIFQFLNTHPDYAQEIAETLVTYNPTIIANDVNNLITLAKSMETKYPNLHEVVSTLQTLQSKLQLIIDNMQRLFYITHQEDVPKEDIQKVTDLLEKDNVNVNVINKIQPGFFGTPLISALLRENLNFDLINTLLKHKADVNGKGVSFDVNDKEINVDKETVIYTPLVLLVSRLEVLGYQPKLSPQQLQLQTDLRDAIKLLLSNGADPDIDYFGEKVRDVLTKFGLLK